MPYWFLKEYFLKSSTIKARVSREELEIFSKILTNARFAANRGRLILLENHYQKLQNIFDSFENYQIGKKRLIEIRTKEEFDENYGMESERNIHQQIRANEKNKHEYEELLDQILRDFRKQLGFNIYQERRGDTG
jgi:hypothetical protein